MQVLSTDCIGTKTDISHGCTCIGFKKKTCHCSQLKALHAPLTHTTQKMRPYSVATTTHLLPFVSSKTLMLVQPKKHLLWTRLLNKHTL